MRCRHRRRHDVDSPRFASATVAATVAATATPVRLWGHARVTPCLRRLSRHDWRSSKSAAYIRARPRPRGSCLCVFRRRFEKDPVAVATVPCGLPPTRPCFGSHVCVWWIALSVGGGLPRGHVCVASFLAPLSTFVFMCRMPMRETEYTHLSHGA